jgi:hypothetical protein
MRSRTWLLPCLALAVATTTANAAPPDNPVGEILAKAQALDGMKRIPRVTYFEGGKGSTVVAYCEFGVRKDRLKTEFVEYKKRGGWQGERCTLELNGYVRKLALASAKTAGEPKREDVTEGVVKDGKLVFTPSGGEKKSIDLPKGSVVNVSLALFVLPAYYDLLPEELHFSVVMGASVRQGFKLTKGALKDGAQEVILMGPGGLKLQVFVSTAPATKGKILKLMVGGETKKPLDEATAQKLIKEANSKGSPPVKAGTDTPRAIVAKLIAACEASDLKAVGACFSPKAPGEFKTLIDGTCPPDEFKKLCKMFSSATITGVTADPGDKRAVVNVTFTSGRKEKLTVVEEAGGWRVLDF